MNVWALSALHTTCASSRSTLSGSKRQGHRVATGFGQGRQAERQSASGPLQCAGQPVIQPPPPGRDSNRDEEALSRLVSLGALPFGRIRIRIRLSFFRFPSTDTVSSPTNTNSSNRVMGKYYCGRRWLLLIICLFLRTGLVFHKYPDAQLFCSTHKQLPLNSDQR